jgi:hypothetical protein
MIPLLFSIFPQLGSTPLSRGKLISLQKLWDLNIGNNIDINQADKQASYHMMPLQDLRVSHLINNGEYEYLPIQDTRHYKYFMGLNKSDRENGTHFLDDINSNWTKVVNGDNFSNIYDTWEGHHNPNHLRNTFFNIKKQGFNRHYPIITDENNIIHDGKNRAVIAQVLSDLYNTSDSVPNLKIFNMDKNPLLSAFQRAYRISQTKDGHKRLLDLIWQKVWQRFKQRATTNTTNDET